METKPELKVRLIKSSRLIMLAAAAACLCAFQSRAVTIPIGVTYSISGSSGNYDLNFSVKSRLPLSTDQDLYFFGVELGAPGITGSPAGYDPGVFPTWDNTGFGGSSITYNNNWFDGSFANLPPGGFLSGFVVHDTDAVAPASVNWFAFTDGSIDYTRGGNFNNNNNPGFEAVALPSSVPDGGASFALLGTAFGGISLFRRMAQKNG